MERELLILRHGKADSPEGVTDIQRPLNDYGKRSAQRVGTWLQQQGKEPDLVLSSSAERALVTAEKTCKAMGLGSAGIKALADIYHADLHGLLKVLRESPAATRRILLVGHNPSLETLLAHLAGTSAHLSAASLACLAVSTEWADLNQGCAVLEQLVVAEDLPEKFPFATEDGIEMRDRPAYYYTQSAVIPYRWTESGLQVLMVASSKVKHWVVPKGIHEPGLSPQESAAKEAYEEAGVSGEIAAEPLGSYKVKKWGAKCTVAVYPMKVSSMLTEDEWEESHRGRHWVSPEQAALWLKEKALRKLVKKLPARLGR